MENGVLMWKEGGLAELMEATLTHKPEPERLTRQTSEKKPQVTSAGNVMYVQPVQAWHCQPPCSVCHRLANPEAASRHEREVMATRALLAERHLYAHVQQHLCVEAAPQPVAMAIDHDASLPAPPAPAPAVSAPAPLPTPLPAPLHEMPSVAPSLATSPSSTSTPDSLPLASSSSSSSSSYTLPSARPSSALPAAQPSRLSTIASVSSASSISPLPSALPAFSLGARPTATAAPTKTPAAKKAFGSLSDFRDEERPTITPAHIPPRRTITVDELVRGYTEMGPDAAIKRFREMGVAPEILNNLPTIALHHTLQKLTKSTDTSFSAPSSAPLFPSASSSSSSSSSSPLPSPSAFSPTPFPRNFSSSSPLAPSPSPLAPSPSPLSFSPSPSHSFNSSSSSSSSIPSLLPTPPTTTPDVQMAAETPSPQEIPEVEVDPSQPTTKIRIRLTDSTTITGTFNLNHTVRHIRHFIDRHAGFVGQYKLLSSFPKKELTNLDATISSSQLQNANLIQNKL
eukprot:TRINITY_DN920_c0_g1_i7.p1 TRINITY_DN920_c0_g1~~TRINITY_DN920_c0_g1_i7.p1  ORF type:complete len:512 (-),score=171.53 TRINITY_DN920_c0_g1_i7:15-1550(-)